MNNDLISRSALHKFVEEEFGDDVPYEWAWALTVVDHAPAVDAVEVVRCKDCKYRSGLNGRPPFMFHICTCAEGLTGAVRDDNFCSYGERKGDDATD